MRERRVAGAPLQRIRILQHIRGNKWKAEWIDPNPGLVHYVESGQLLAPWKEHKAFLKEEANALAIREHNEEVGYEKDSPLDRALEQVFESIADQVSYHRGTASGSPETWTRVRARAGI
jgi:hypothetical protein